MLFAALVHPQPPATDHMLQAFGERLLRQGRNVHGLIQRADLASGVLLDVRTGDRYPLYQNLGGQSSGCNLDTQHLAAASQVLRKALEASAELVIVNRFGKMETQGEGLTQEFLSLMAAEVPVITVVRDDHLPAWRTFSAGLALELEATPQALQRWYAQLPLGREIHHNP
jgi:hypothetical protein